MTEPNALACTIETYFTVTIFKHSIVVVVLLNTYASGKLGLMLDRTTPRSMETIVGRAFGGSNPPYKILVLIVLGYFYCSSFLFHATALY